MRGFSDTRVWFNKPPEAQKAASYTSKEILNGKNITTRKTNSKHKNANSETINIPELAALFLN